ncbi:MAG: STAS domain-containing protein [Acidobacteriota bacterium]
MRRFEIDVRERLPNLVVMAMRGRCIAAMADVLQAALDEELQKKPRGLLLDGSGLEELEGPCLFEILAADRQLRARQGGLALYSLPSLVAGSLKQADLLEDIFVFPNFATARQALETHIRNARCAAAAGAILKGKGGRRRRRKRLRRREGQKLAAAVAGILDRQPVE